MYKHTAEQLNQPRSDSWELERAEHHYLKKNNSNTDSKNLLGRQIHNDKSWISSLSQKDRYQTHTEFSETLNSSMSVPQATNLL